MLSSICKKSQSCCCIVEDSPWSLAASIFSLFLRMVFLVWFICNNVGFLAGLVPWIHLSRESRLDRRSWRGEHWELQEIVIPKVACKFSFGLSSFYFQVANLKNVWYLKLEYTCILEKHQSCFSHLKGQSVPLKVYGHLKYKACAGQCRLSPEPCQSSQSQKDDTKKLGKVFCMVWVGRHKFSRNFE